MIRKTPKGPKGLTLVLVVVALLSIISILGQQYDIQKVKDDKLATSQRIAQLEEEAVRLQKERDLLKEPAYLEKIAREEYNMVGKNEIPIFIVEKNTLGEENKSR